MSVQSSVVCAGRRGHARFAKRTTMPFLMCGGGPVMGMREAGETRSRTARLQTPCSRWNCEASEPARRRRQAGR